MKKVYASVVALGVAFSSFAQVTPATLQKSRLVENHTIALEQPTVIHSAAATGDTINSLYYDFSTAANWTFGNASTPSADWELTTTGPYGDFSESYGTLESSTAGNGWAMFDSDGVGSASSIHDSWIQLANSVDLTGFPSVAVVFQHYNVRFQNNCYLEVSTDGTTWTTFEVDAAQALNSAGDNPASGLVNISGAIAANPATVWIRFRFEGTWDYSWQVDDVAFVEGAADDLKLTDVWHGDIINAWEYQQIPLAQIQEVVLGATSTNAGGAAQTNAIYTYDISDGTSSVSSGTFPATNTSIDPTIADTTWYATGFTPSALGTYTVTISVAGDQTDELPSDNEAMSAFMVTESIYAHDDVDNIEFQINGGDDQTSGNANEYKVGMYYDMFANATITAVQVAFGGNTTTSSCIVEVFDAADLSSPLATTVYDFQSDDIPTGAEINLINILIEDGDGLPLSAGTTYFVAIGNGGEGEDLWVLASDGDADFGQLRYGPFGTGGAIDWYTGYTTSPMVRANFDPTVGIEENEDVSGVSMYPNPASDLINVAFVSKENQDIIVNIIDVNGALVQSQQRTAKVGEANTFTFNTEDLAAGIYMVQLQGTNSSLTQRVVVQ